MPACGLAYPKTPLCRPAFDSSSQPPDEHVQGILFPVNKKNSAVIWLHRKWHEYGDNPPEQQPHTEGLGLQAQTLRRGLSHSIQCNLEATISRHNQQTRPMYVGVIPSLSTARNPIFILPRVATKDETRSLPTSWTAKHQFETLRRFRHEQLARCHKLLSQRRIRRRQQLERRSALAVTMGRDGLSVMDSVRQAWW